MNETIENEAIKRIGSSWLLDDTVKAFENGYKIVEHEGGSRSSKTYSIFQFLFGRAIDGKGEVFTIVRDKLTWIKSTLLVDFKQLVEMLEVPVYPEINFNRADQVYNVNGSEFAFFGLDYAEKLHGRKQDWFWINEALEVEKRHFDQLEMRTTKGGLIDYNPYNDVGWVYDIQKRPDVYTIKSTMWDNPFLEENIRKKILSYKPTPENIRNGTADNYMWEVYGLGNKAKLQGVIFVNWDIVEGIPDGARFLGYGLDFGFRNDPTALVGLWEFDKELYADNPIYRTGMLNSDIINELKKLKVNSGDLIVGDSSEPKSIEEIRRAGFNIKGAYKGADSVRYGIDLLKSFKIHITKRSIEMENELRKYKWKEDRNGNMLNEPIDELNHSIDSLRYIAMEKLGNKQEVQILNRELLGL